MVSPKSQFPVQFVDVIIKPRIDLIPFEYSVNCNWCSYLVSLGLKLRSTNILFKTLSEIVGDFLLNSIIVLSVKECYRYGLV